MIRAIDYYMAGYSINDIFIKFCILANGENMKQCFSWIKNNIQEKGVYISQ